MPSQSLRGDFMSEVNYRVGTPGRTRTPNLRIRRPLLYPLSYRGTVIADQYRPF